ncbi:MAG: YfhO family protein, partial [Butyrivibrio sp.]|nr:YfhO family protein [Butyrivibrio sp.]
EIPYTVELEKKVKDKGNNTLKVKKAGSKMTVSFEGQPASESYLYIEGLDFEGEYDAVNIEVTAYSGENAKTTKTISFKTPESEFYSGWHDYIVNMGYSQDSISKIEITFPEKGTYSYTDMKVVCQGMENIEARIVDLKQESLENVDLHKNPISYMTNEITGTITNATDKILLFNIPYQDGWTAYVDGKKVSLSKANTMFMAISLPAGEHDIRLTYNTPGIVLGLILSVIGFISLISICIYEKKKAYIK